MKMSQASTNVIVWEWMNEFGRWRPYEPNVTQFIENAYQNNSNQVNLGGADSSLSSYSIDFITTCQIRLGTGTARPIRRSTYPQSSLPGKGIIWQWEGDVRGQWHRYDMDIACLLEDYYCQNPKPGGILDLSKSTLKLPYHIDFGRMTQIRIETGRVRKIRRATTQQAYPSGNGATSSLPTSTVTVQSGSSSLNSFSSSTLASPTKRSSSSGVSPAKKFKSDHSSNQNITSTGMNNNHTGISNSSSFTFIPNSGSASGSQISGQNSIQGLGRPLTRNYLNTNSVTLNNSNSSFQNSNPYNQLGQSNNMASLSGHGNSIQSQGNRNYSNFIPNVNMNPSLPYQNMQMFSMSGNTGNIQQQSFSSMPVVSMGQSRSFYGNQNISSPVGLFSTHHGLPGGSIISHFSGQNFAQGQSSGSNPLGSRVASSGSEHLDVPVEARIPNTVPKQNKRGKSSDTEMFEQFTEVLQNPPTDEDCCICCEKLTHASGYGEGQVENHVVYQLNKCSHMFHKLCLIAMYDSGSKNGSMQCPTCKTIYGEKHGNCPKGTMEYSKLSQSLPGYPDCQTIRIYYHISPGVQGQEHPHPGKRFSCRGFPRICFLPDNNEGRKILKLLMVAWKRRLTFTIGHSTTTGEADTVTWNEIHHKTEFGSNISGHGFPDDKYFDNVMQELAVQGVTEKDI